MNGVQEPSNCFTFVNEVIHPTYQQCRESITYAVQNKLFVYSDPETGYVEQPVDWYCVDWTAVKVSY